MSVRCPSSSQETSAPGPGWHRTSAAGSCAQMEAAQRAARKPARPPPTRRRRCRIPETSCPCSPLACACPGT
eukprot:366391-Chlamydomonas_euryale.AAC.10